LVGLVVSCFLPSQWFFSAIQVAASLVISAFGMIAGFEGVSGMAFCFQPAVPFLGARLLGIFRLSRPLSSPPF
jgi:hypothetical protein